MGTIQSSVGLVSGINTAQIIDQLIQIESRPRAFAQQRLIQIQSQQAAFLDLNTAVSGLSTAARAFNASRLFRGATANTSNENVLTASASAGAAVGSYSFVVDRLVSTDSSISGGFADRDTTGLGLTQLSFEVGGGRLDSDTRLESLNGGAGVQRGEITITDSAGESATVDLSRAVSISDVLDAINSAGGIDVTASVTGYGLTLTDNAGGGGNLRVEDQLGSTTAGDLGISGTGTLGVLSGAQVLRIGENTALSTLNDGNGVSFGAGGVAPPADFTIDAGLNSYDIVLGEIASTQPDPDDPDSTITVVEEPAALTVGDVIERIESQTGGDVSVTINAEGTGLVLTNNQGFPFNDITVNTGPTASTAAIDLGFIDRGSTTNTDTGAIESRRLLAGLNSRLVSNLAGGQGVSSGEIAFVPSTGALDAFTVTLTGDESISDIIAAINANSGGDVTASLNSAGNGLLITDNTNGPNQLEISDASGQAASDLNIATAGADGSVDSGNLQSRYVSDATLLEDLRGGQGIGTGSFRITDSTGTSSTISIGSGERTVADLLRKINSAGVDVTGRINDNGDGITIEDSAGGAAALNIEDASGIVAKNLGIAGTADNSGGPNELVGSNEVIVEFDPGDTLQDVVNAINDSRADVNASIVSSGSGATPNRLVITSRATGESGRVVIDTFGEDLGFSTLTRGEDALAFFGSTDPASGFLITGNTNSLSDVIEGVTIDLTGTSEDAVTVNVSRDVEGIETGLNEFVDAFNNVLDRIDFHTRFDSETEERGVLLGDATALGVKNTLTRLALSAPEGVSGQFTNLTQIGITVGEGGQLSFDSAKFREAYDADPEAVEDLVAALDAEDPEENVPVFDSEGNILEGVTTPGNGEREFTRVGVLESLAQYADSLTDFAEGRFARRDQAFDTQIRLQEDRIDNLTVQIDAKRARLEREFLAMEQAIAALQGQQTALGGISAPQSLF